MIAIACIEDRNGVAFFHRRLSQDRVLTSDICQDLKGNSLYLSAYSSELFRPFLPAPDQLHLVNDYAETPEDGICFLELTDPSVYETRMKEFILYRWNRRYPADVFCQPFFENSNKWILKTSIDMVGNSHEKITKEIYKPRENTL